MHLACCYAAAAPNLWWPSFSTTQLRPSSSTISNADGAHYCFPRCPLSVHLLLQCPRTHRHTNHSEHPINLRPSASSSVCRHHLFRTQTRTLPSVHFLQRPRTATPTTASTQLVPFSTQLPSSTNYLFRTHGDARTAFPGVLQCTLVQRPPRTVVTPTYSQHPTTRALLQQLRRQLLLF